MVYFVCWGGSLYLNRLDNFMFSLADDVQVICLRGPKPNASGSLAGVGASLLLAPKEQYPASSYGVGRGLV